MDVFSRLDDDENMFVKAVGGISFMNFRRCDIFRRDIHCRLAAEGSVNDSANYFPRIQHNMNYQLLCTC